MPSCFPKSSIAAWCLVLAEAAAASGQVTVSAVVPATLPPGGTARLTLEGKDLSDAVGLATVPDIGRSTIESIDPKQTKATLTVAVPPGTIGPLRLWPTATGGPGTPRFVVVDDLPAAPCAGGHTSPATACAVAPPLCIDGVCSAGRSDFYRFNVAAGQRLAFEVVTRQIGSAMDPFVRLLDAAGRLLASGDDGPTGPECRFSHVFAAGGEVVLEVRHSAHAGGSPYHLRIGDFPIVSHAMPLALQRGGGVLMAFGGADAAAVSPREVRVPADARDAGMFLAVALPGGRSSAWVPLLLEDAPQLVEASANGILPVPVGVSGRLEKPGERDAYRVRAQKGEGLRFASRARSLGCATVPRMRVLDPTGKVVAESTVTAVDEPALEFVSPADGEYRFEVDDLARRGGPDFGYFVAVEPAGVAVEVKPDPKTRLAHAVESGQGCAPIDLVVKRAGYEGEVRVSLAEDVPGIRLINPVIPEKVTEARVYLATDADWTPRSLAMVRLRARAGDRPAVAVSTLAVRAVQEKVVALPGPVGDGGILLAGVAGGAPRFVLAPTGPVQLSRSGTTHQIVMDVKRLVPEFKGPVSVVGPLLPRGLSVTSRMDNDVCVLTLTGAVAAGEEPTALELLAVADVGSRTVQAGVILPVTWTGAPMASPSGTAAGAMPVVPPAFAGDYTAAVERLRPRIAASLSAATEALRVKGAVGFGPESFATFTAGRLDGVGPSLGAAWSVSLWFMNRLATDARPVTAYLFSRGADGEIAGGDHLGIGGTFRPDMPGKLLVFNGNARNGILLGRSRIAPGEWHHVVIVRDGKRVRLHLDGGIEPEIDADFEPTAADAGGFFFGARSDNFAPLQGGIAHVALFDRPLSPDESRFLHSAARAAPAASPGSKNGDPPPVPPTAAAEAGSPPQSAPVAARPEPPAAPPAVRSDAADAEPLRPGLHVFPAPIALDGARDRQQIAVTTVDDAGFPCDWTRKAAITIADPAVATLHGTTVLPVGDGTTTVTIEADGLRRDVPITVRNAATVRPVRFESELLAALSKQTCSSGACHGSPSGKGGFRLSLRASDRQLDELTLIREEFGRRVNAIDPDASLLLRKPLMQLPHGGGRQLTSGDAARAILRAWIAEGARADPPDVPRCVRLQVSPAGRQVQRLEQGGRQIVVTASDSDGTRRDVSHLAAYESSAPAVATVDAAGWVDPKKRGETVILVRYLEQIELVPLMFIEQSPDFVWRAAPEHNEIDRLIDEKLRDLQYPPSPVCSDAEFLRRLHLDVVGLLPTVAETEAFLADTAADKRTRLIDQLLEREEHARFWALKWGDILRLTKRLAGDQGVFKYHRWLEDSFRTNKPHDQFARELLLGAGSSYDNPAATFYRTTADMNETVETVSQLFLGVRLQCAKCHNHPFDRWSQDDYYGLGAFFERVKKRKTPIADETFVYVAPSGETKQPRTGRIVKPRLPGVGDLDLTADADRREAFVEWLLAHDNPFFARVEANRVWSQFFARGIVHPVDEFRDSNPPSNAPLLEWLGSEFRTHGYDRRRLIRTILQSRTYQTSSAATPLNKEDSSYFSHQLPRLLSAEQLLDAIGQVVGLEQPFQALPAGTKATHLPAPDISGSDFLKMFGQPGRGTVCACERADDSSLGMAIELTNGKLIHAKLVDPLNRFRTELAAGRSVDEVVRGLYLAALCRPPTADELSAAIARCTAAKDAVSGVEDVCWALLNSDEFVFQH